MPALQLKEHFGSFFCYGVFSEQQQQDKANPPLDYRWQQREDGEKHPPFFLGACYNQHQLFATPAALYSLNAWNG